MIRVLIAEDQAMVAGALAALLGIEPDIEVIATTADGREAIDQTRSLQPDVVVADIEMPKLTGIELARVVKGLTPAPRVVILTTFARPGYLRRALEAGASAYLLKDMPSSRLADAIRRVCAGGKVIDPGLATEALDAADPFTYREQQILRLAGDGRTGPEIASELDLSEGTVRNYLSDAIRKTGGRNRVEAIRIARAKGWL